LKINTAVHDAESMSSPIRGEYNYLPNVDMAAMNIKKTAARMKTLDFSVCRPFRSRNHQ
jgi:hypothetical protein